MMNDSSSRIAQIDQKDAYQICSGQSVVDLSTAVKELVENAMDAEAKVIDIRLKEYGKTTVQVIDNGCGIKKEDYENVVKKHYTSKIAQFKDLETVATYGFRGEALSSLCQLSHQLTVFTRTKEDSLGTILSFDKMGNLVSQSTKARPIGTTITIENLFQSLPVRYKDFHKSIKKHYAKLLRVLQSYALIGQAVKFSCTNTVGKTVQRVLTTQMNGTLLDKISNVFGTKYSKTLIPVHFQLGEEAKVEGFVSKTGEGVGRADSDRQFLYVNGRPVNIAKFVKGLNEIWRTYEMKHKPACVLNFIFGAGLVDVNVSPDKRETYIVNQAIYLEKFKQCLDELWKPSRGKFVVQSQISFNSSQSTIATESQSSIDLVSQSQEVEEESKTTVSSRLSVPKRRRLIESIKPSDDSDDEDVESKAPSYPSRYPKDTTATESKLTELPTKRAVVAKHTPKSSYPDVEEVESNPTTREEESPPQLPIHRETALEETESFEKKKSKSIAAAANKPSPKWNSVEIVSTRASASSYSPAGTKRSTEQEQTALISAEKRLRVSKPTENLYPSSEHRLYRTNKNTDQRLTNARELVEGAESRNVVDLVDSDSEAKSPPGTLSCSVESIKQLCENVLGKPKESESPLLQIPAGCSTACATPFDPEHAAAAFERILKKENFKEMEILGQFNLGFIVTRFRDDLFIIDQHASDEKNTFEKLQQTTEMHQQPLVRPQPLELTAIEEMTVIDRIDIFVKNGFRFDIHHDAEPTKKLYLTAIPFSKQTQFGAEDVRELVSMLIDCPEKDMIRLPKLVAMYASRACRTSVMIGTALRHDEMVRIVQNLSTLEQPWNCPHGRPTMRHLVSLRKIASVKHQ